MCSVAIASLLAGGCAAADDGGDSRLGVCEPPPDVGPAAPDSAIDVGAPRRAACEFRPGARVTETVGPQARVPDVVEHVIIVLRENRSFDHYLGAYTPPPGQAYVDPLPTDEPTTNPDPDERPGGGTVQRFPEEHYCTKNPAHEWTDVHLQYNNGRLDGFVGTSNTGGDHDRGCAAMGYYTEADLPFYYWLARNFAISDSYFSSLLGPTLPNVLYYYFATSCGATENVESVAHGCASAQTSIFELLEGHATYRVYNDAQPPVDSAALSLGAYPLVGLGSIQDFEDAVADDELPDVVFVEPNYGHLLGDQNDEHPPSNVQAGQAFTFHILETLMANPDVWEHSVVFITWDEHGGYYDHVVPPTACPPDGHRPYDFEFDRLGFRVPFFVVSPFAKEGYVSHHTADHTSILRFIEAWKGLGALTNRDANAWPLLDMFDFDRPRNPTPPPGIADMSMDPTHIASCAEDDPISSCFPRK